MPEPAEMTTAERRKLIATTLYGYNSVIENLWTTDQTTGDTEWNDDAALTIAGAILAKLDQATPDAASPPPAGEGVVERVGKIIYDFLDERLPDGGLPGGVQLFADPGDHLDPEFKHEAACEELAARILAALTPVRVVGREDLRDGIAKIIDGRKTDAWTVDIANEMADDILAYVAKSDGPRQAAAEPMGTLLEGRLLDAASLADMSAGDHKRKTAAWSFCSGQASGLRTAASLVRVAFDEIAPPDQGGQVAAEGAGFVLVPVEPTEAMIAAGEGAFRSADGASCMEPAKEAYDAMIAARPPATEGEG